MPPKTATLAQLAEHPICNRKVVGSIPMGGSIRGIISIRVFFYKPCVLRGYSMNDNASNSF